MNDLEDYTMAITAITNGDYNMYADTISVSSTRYAIQGDMFTVERNVTAEMWEKAGISKDDIKMAMVAQIVGELIQSKHISFTSQMDPATGNVKIRARLFVTPDDQTRTLSQNGY